MSKNITSLPGRYDTKTAGKLSGSFLILLLLSACASVPAPPSVNDTLTPAVYLNNVPFIPQQQYQCGPAALAMLLRHAGTTVSVETLVKQVYLPQRNGSLQIEILASTRHYHHIPYVIEPKLEHLLREIEAGNPVLVLQNLGLSWAPIWHYAVAIGYDLPQQQIILHSGTDAARTVALRTFARTWQRADRWGLVITAIDQVPASADPQRFIQAITELKGPKNGDSRHRAYIAAAEHWPGQLLPLLSLGNSFYSHHDLAAAEQAYRTTIEHYPDNAMALNNLAQTLADQNKLDEAAIFITRAIEVGGPFMATIENTREEIRQQQASH